MKVKIKLVKTKDDLITSYQLRKTVFIDEQNISFEDEFDLLDKDWYVLLLLINKIAIATLRCKLTEDGFKVSRVCTLKEYRSYGYTRRLMLHAEKIAKKLGCKKMVLEAQLSAIPFYEKCAYIAEGEIFMDAGIEHKKMYKLLK